MKHLLLFNTLILVLMGCNSSSLSDIEDDPAEDIEVEATLYWNAPTERANGESISDDEIGGYSIRYRENDAEEYTYILIPNADLANTTWQLDDITNPENQIIEVAVFDTDGIYSDYVEAITD